MEANQDRWIRRILALRSWYRIWKIQSLLKMDTRSCKARCPQTWKMSTNFKRTSRPSMESPRRNSRTLWEVQKVRGSRTERTPLAFFSLNSQITALSAWHTTKPARMSVSSLRSFWLTRRTQPKNPKEMASISKQTSLKRKILSFLLNILRFTEASWLSPWKGFLCL